jgi:transcriptional regulator with XRE-family HTH domain
MKVSKTFIEQIKLSPLRQYKIAQEAGLHPSTLSKIMCGIEKIKERDPRVLRVARVLKLSREDCFEGAHPSE